MIPTIGSSTIQPGLIFQQTSELQTEVLRSFRLSRRRLFQVFSERPFQVSKPLYGSRL